MVSSFSQGSPIVSSSGRRGTAAYEWENQIATLLLDSHRLRQIARLVDVIATGQRYAYRDCLHGDR